MWNLENDIYVAKHEFDIWLWNPILNGINVQVAGSLTTLN